MLTRRDFYRFGTLGLGGLLTLALAVPGVGYLLTPLRKGRAEQNDADFRSLTRLNELRVGEPRSFAIIEERQDAWVKYPAEPIGSVWLIRQPEEAEAPVLAFSSECPHLGCAINLNPDGRSFLCPCHTSAFTLEGERLNQIPPRGMDLLEVKLVDPADPTREFEPTQAPSNAVVAVKFQRFRTMTEEKSPIA